MNKSQNLFTDSLIHLSVFLGSFCQQWQRIAQLFTRIHVEKIQYFIFNHNSTEEKSLLLTQGLETRLRCLCRGVTENFTVKLYVLKKKILRADEF